MDPEVTVWLDDIRRAIDSILKRTSGVSSFAEFERDETARVFAERYLIVVGEAMKRVLAVQPDIAITNATRIVRTRHRLVHEYDDIDVETLYIIVVNHLPLLQQEVRALLDQTEP